MHRTTITRTAAAGLVAGALLLAGCGSSDSGSSSTTTTTKDKATTTAADTLKLEDVWARQSPMGTTAGAVYLTITSPIDDELTGASVPTSIAQTTEIHETVAADGGDAMTSTTVEMGGDTESTTTAAAMGEEATTTAAMGSGDETTTTMAGGSDSMTMRPVDSIELPAGETVKLEPGGYHIMLLDLAAPLKKGQTFEVTLTFKEAGTKTVTATVREA